MRTADGAGRPPAGSPNDLKIHEWLAEYGLLTLDAFLASMHAVYRDAHRRTVLLSALSAMRDGSERDTSPPGAPPRSALSAATPPSATTSTLGAAAARIADVD